MPDTPVVFSASSINTFLRCEVQWEFAYVRRMRMPPNVRQVLGIATHEAIELNMAQKVYSKTDLPTEDVLDAFSTAFDHEVAEVEANPDADAADLPGPAKDSGVGLVTLHHTSVAPKIQPVWVEQAVQFAINGVPYSGVVDLVDDRGRVRDWKTSARRPNVNSQTYVLNMTGYALGYRQKTGQVESEVVLDYLIRQKTPIYLPVTSGAPITDRAVGTTFATIVGKVARRVESGDFLPTGLANNACSWCGYRQICPYYRSR